MDLASRLGAIVGGFTCDMLIRKVGIRRGTRLIAAAGTHVISPQWGVAAVGNVFTHRVANNLTGSVLEHHPHQAAGPGGI